MKMSFDGGTAMNLLVRTLLAYSLFIPCASLAVAQDYLGQLGGSKYNYDSTNNPYGLGSRYNANSINNPYGRYGSKYSAYSATNPYAVNAPKLYDSEGNYRGKLSANRYDPDSISNPYGRYGSKYSPESINNPYGAGSRYRLDSPNNPYGTGWKIVGDE
jgi:hypothetical protein